MKLKVRKLVNRPYFKIYDKKTGIIYGYSMSKSDAKMKAKFLDIQGIS